MEFNVWDVQTQYRKTASFPSMSEDEQKTYLDFLKCQVSDNVESYEKFAYNHGGTGEEAKSRLAAITEAEQELKAFSKALESEAPKGSDETEGDYEGY